MGLRGSLAARNLRRDGPQSGTLPRKLGQIVACDPNALTHVSDALGQQSSWSPSAGDVSVHFNRLDRFCLKHATWGVLMGGSDWQPLKRLLGVSPAGGQGMTGADPRKSGHG